MDGREHDSRYYLDTVSFRRTATKRPRLVFNRYGQLECRLPKRYPHQLARLFVIKNASWAASHQPAIPALKAGLYIADYQIATETMTAGRCRVDHLNKLLHVAPRDCPFMTAAQWQSAVKIITARSKNHITGRYDYLADRHRLRAAKLSIRAMTSRWGSCTRQKHITINSLAAQLPGHLLDYLLLHELAHLKHLNHGRQYYRLLEELDPLASQHRAQLRKLPISIVSQPSPATWAMR